MVLKRSIVCRKKSYSHEIKKAMNVMILAREEII